MGENPVWQFFCVVRKKKERKRKADAQANASESNMLLPADNRKSHKFISPG